MNRLYDHLADIVETADGGFDMTHKGRQYFSRFLRQHGKSIRDIRTHAELIDALGECNAADFAAPRQRRPISRFPKRHGPTGLAGNESMHRLVA